MGLNLMGFGRSVRDTSLVGDPVDFPSLATIGGEGLLKVGGIGRDLGPNIAHQNDPAVEGFLVEKFATAVGKLANRRLPERTILAVGPVETPLMGLRIVETEGQTLDVTGRAGGLELFEPSAAIPDFAGDGRAVKLNPGRRAGQGMEETLVNGLLTNLRGMLFLMGSLDATLLDREANCSLTTDTMCQNLFDPSRLRAQMGL